MNHKQPKFEIGTRFIKLQNIKSKRIETIIDIYKTTNSNNEIVEIQYLIENEMNGQKVKGLCNEITILRGQIVWEQ